LKKKTHHEKGAGGLAQGIGSEFKHQDSKKKKKKQGRKEKKERKEGRKACRGPHVVQQNGR
jgi:hypothetical protein